MSDKNDKPSAVEGFKSDSHYLRGEIPGELADENPFFGKGSIQLLKHHGTYQQDDRDQRAAARAEKKPGGKEFIFMVRTAIPGGALSSEQMLAELDLADEIGNQTLRITTRQGLQLHGVPKGDLRRAIQRINEVRLTTVAACGDVERNVMCIPVPYKKDDVHKELQQTANALATALRPRTREYHQVWLIDPDSGDKEKIYSWPPAGTEGYDAGPGPNKEGDEPLYGPTYLPRKFKTAFGLPDDNSADVYASDLGYLAICDEGQIVGYNVLVGGSFGVTPSAEKTFPAVGKPLAFIKPDAVIPLAQAIVKVQRDNGNRSDRKVARMKYLIHDWGIEKFKAKVEEYYGQPLDPPRSIEPRGFHDGMGAHEQGDGRWFYGLNVENGRIKDEGEFRLRTALRQICRELAPPLRLTPHQGIIFADLQESDLERLTSILREHGVPLSEEISLVRRWSMACPALPTCGLAVTESERVLPSMMDQLEQELDQLGLGEEIFTTRMTGCPNGCARPYNSDVGLVGKTKGKYTIFLGGSTYGHRLNEIYRDLVPEEEVVPALVTVLKQFKGERQEGELFGDFCQRLGVKSLVGAD